MLKILLNTVSVAPPDTETVQSSLFTLSPYLTGHLKRYGDFVIDLQSIPAPLEGAIRLPIALNNES